MSGGVIERRESLQVFYGHKLARSAPNVLTSALGREEESATCELAKAPEHVRMPLSTHRPMSSARNPRSTDGTSGGESLEGVAHWNASWAQWSGLPERRQSFCPLIFEWCMGGQTQTCRAERRSSQAFHCTLPLQQISLRYCHIGWIGAKLPLNPAKQAKFNWRIPNFKQIRTIWESISSACDMFGMWRSLEITIWEPISSVCDVFGMWRSLEREE